MLNHHLMNIASILFNFCRPTNKFCKCIKTLFILDFSLLIFGTKVFYQFFLLIKLFLPEILKLHQLQDLFFNLPRYSSFIFDFVFEGLSHFAISINFQYQNRHKNNPNNWGYGHPHGILTNSTFTLFIYSVLCCFGISWFKLTCS